MPWLLLYLLGLWLCIIVGKKKERPAVGLLVGFFLGLLGVPIMLLIPKKEYWPIP